MSADVTQNRAVIVDSNFTQAVRALQAGTASLDPLSRDEARDLFRAQITSRHLDLAARALRKENRGYYTIGSSGHEGNAAVAHALRPTDPAFLHYRSGAFFLERARQAGYEHAVRDVLLGMMAARSEPIAGGRHKVWGSAQLAIPPQTSTIASHLPKAVGCAYALDLRGRIGIEAGDGPPEDGIVVCSFGDASVNHSTAQGALNAASYLSFSGQPVPILFVCEDNGIGISVPTEPRWIASSLAARPGLRYVQADGLDLRAATRAARDAVAQVRETRQPAILHLECVRLLGHAGSDAELSYHTEARIRADEARDPLIASARLLIEAGAFTVDEVLDEYESARRLVASTVTAIAGEPGLQDADDVMWPIAARPRPRATKPDNRRAFWADQLPEEGPALPLSGHINRALGDLLATQPDVLVFGEDVGRKGGIYGLTRRLQRLAGRERVQDSFLDEQWILGLAMGAAHVGLLAVAEIAYLAFLHNAEDQLRGEAATLSFFSQGQFTNPMVVRVPAYGYQKGFGGHFHNDNSIAVLRDLPGVILASPSRGDDAAAMLRACVASGAVCVFLEPIALYHTADLYQPGDGLWLAPYRHDDVAEIGRARMWGDPDAPADLLLVSFANGVPMSLRVARRLERDGLRCRVLDLRWLAPLPLADLLAAAAAVPAVLVVDETRATGGVSEALITALHELPARIARVASKDSFIPLGPAAELVLLSEDEIERAARALTA